MAIRLEPQVNIPEFYKDPLGLMTNDPFIQHIVFFSGRTSGKSYNLAQIIVITTFKEKDNNILVVRATKAQIKNSSYTQISNIIDEMGLSKFFIKRSKAMEIENKATGSKINFEGIEDDPERIKGFTPKHDKLALVVFEEFTELNSDFPIEVAKDTLYRYNGSKSNDGMVKFVYLGNPSRWNAHWSWDFVEKSKVDMRSKVFSPTWETIKGFLNKHAIASIEHKRDNNHRYYEWAYLGKRLSYEGLVYETFNKDCFTDMSDFENKKPVAIICGLDPASKRDKTAFIISVLYNTGQVVCLDMWSYNPKEEGRKPLSPSQQGEKIVKFFNDFLFRKENFKYRMLAKFVISDPASGGLDVELRNNYGNFFDVLTVDRKERKKDIERNQNAITSNRVMFKKNEDNLKPLYDELSMMVWRDKNIMKELKKTKADMLTIGDDDCHDAMTYILTFALTNARFMDYNPDLFNNTQQEVREWQ